MEMKANRKQRERTQWKGGTAGLGSRRKAREQQDRTKTDRGPPMWEQRAMGRDEGGRGREAWYPSQAPLEAGR